MECFGATALFAGECGDRMMKLQNEKKEMNMACSISLAKLDLTPEQRKNMDPAMAEHMKTGCTEAREAKYMEQAKTLGQYTKLKEKYDRVPKEKMGGCSARRSRIKASRRERSRRVSRTDIQDERYYFRAQRFKRDWKCC